MHPFRRPDSASLDDMLADGAVAVLEKRGADGLNPSAIARWLGISRQSLSERLYDAGGARRRCLQIVVVTFGQRWLEWVESVMYEEQPVPAMPVTDEEILGTRVWTALAELARGEHAAGNPDVAGAIQRIRRLERQSVRTGLTNWLHAYPAADDVIDLCALTDGLRAAVTAPDPELSSGEAIRLLVRRIEQIRETTPPRAA